MAEEKREVQENQKEDFELFSYDPMVIVWDVLKRWYLILTVAILAGMAAFVVTEQTYRPEYTTNTTFVVSSRENSSTVFDNLQAASGVASVFSEVLNSSILRDEVLNELGMTSFGGTIEAEAVEETNLITMKVTDKDPRTAFLVTRSIVENHPKVSRQVLGDTVLEVLQEPKVPMAPANPMAAAGRMKKVMILAAAAMCVLLAVLSFLRDTVRSKKEAEQKLDVRILGELHHEKKVKNVRLSMKKNRSGILISDPMISFSYVERIRKLRRQVEQHMPENGKVLLISSALENEGKTTVAVNLAVSMAQKQKKILLIDGDLRRPACHKIMKRENVETGITDVLMGKASLEKAEVSYGKGGNLTLLLGKGECENSMELTGSDEMRKLLEEERKKYDFIIIDTPPMAVAGDAEYLAELADASVLVVRQNAASAKMIDHMLDILAGAHGKLLGCVLNNVYTPLLSEMGSYGYGYSGSYYGSYGHYGKYGKYGHYGNYGAVHTAHRKSGEGKNYEQ